MYLYQLSLLLLLVIGLFSQFTNKLPEAFLQLFFTNLLGFFSSNRSYNT